MAPIPRNPYVAGNPVGDSPAYVGREDVLRAVMRVLRHEHQNAIVLYGQRRIGKTSILQYLKAHLPEEGPYCPVYFDLQDKAALPLGKVLEHLAQAIAPAVGLPPPELGPDPETAFRDRWLPALLDALPGGCALVLLMDEFDVLADPKTDQAAQAFFPYLRGLLGSDPSRLKFEFVIGRNIGDLDNIALSVFKGTPSHRVSLLSREDLVGLVRLAETNGTLSWTDAAVDRVWELTRGHPFLTQQLCLHVWERAYDQEPDEPPAVTPEAVDAAVDEALDASRNTMEWLWDGLPPAERVVASTLAQAGTAAISAEALERLLYDSGVRVVIRELQSAPQLLQDWDLIEPTDGGYRFRVELLRRWIAANKPLRRVQEELDYVEPVAENLYQAALGMYRGGQLGRAEDLLRQSIALNPNHVRASQLLADLLLAGARAGDAVELLEALYKYQPAAARPRLIQALLIEAQRAQPGNEQLAHYEKVLELDPTQPEALAARHAIWQTRGDSSLRFGDLEAALIAYQAADDADGIARVQEEMRHHELAAQLQGVEQAEQGGAYTQALDRVRELSAQYPDARDWAADVDRLESKTRLDELYEGGRAALESGDRRTAQALLAQVVAADPTYREATRYLHLAVTGVDLSQARPAEAAAGGRVAEPRPRPALPGRKRTLAVVGVVVVLVAAGILAGLILRRGFPAATPAPLVTATGTVTAGTLGSVRSVTYSPDGKILALGNSRSQVTLVDAQSGDPLRTLDGDSGNVFGVAFSPDGKTLAAGFDDKGTILLWDVETGKLLRAFEGHTGGVYSVAFSPDGTKLASGSADRTAIIWDVETGTALHTLQKHIDAVFDVAFSPDGKTLATGSGDYTVILWDVETGSALKTLGDQDGAVWSVAFSPDGTLLASGSEDTTVVLWDVATGSSIFTLQGNGGGVRRVAFCPAGDWLAAASLSNPTVVWDVASRTVLHTLEGHSDYVWGIAFSPDEVSLATGSDDQTVILWDTSTWEQIRTIR